MPTDGYLDYLEIPAPDIPASKRFYGKAFGWTFTDYGPDYVEFNSDGRKGGFNPELKVVSGGALVVLYATDLDAMEKKLAGLGAEILSHISFSGGRRFHFRDPNGNELAVWSDK